MEKRYKTIMHGVEYCLCENSSGKNWKLVIKRKFKTLCELEFDNPLDFMNLTQELENLGKQWLAEEEYNSKWYWEKIPESYGLCF